MKIPRLLRARIGQGLTVENVRGVDFPEDSFQLRPGNSLWWLHIQPPRRALPYPSMRACGRASFQLRVNPRLFNGRIRSLHQGVPRHGTIPGREPALRPQPYSWQLAPHGHPLSMGAISFYCRSSVNQPRSPLPVVILCISMRAHRTKRRFILAEPYAQGWKTPAQPYRPRRIP